MGIKKLKKNGISFYSISGGERLLFVPALFFVCLGLLTVIAPKLVFTLVAGFFLFIGLIVGFIAWKFISLRKKLESTFKDLQSKVVVHRTQASNNQSFEIIDIDGTIIQDESKKKIIFH